MIGGGVGQINLIVGFGYPPVPQLDDVGKIQVIDSALVAGKVLCQHVQAATNIDDRGARVRFQVRPCLLHQNHVP